MYEGIVQDLIDELGRLPGVGPKSAQRIAFHLLEADPTDVRRLAEARVDGTVGGGAVTVTVNGVGELQAVSIRPGGFDGSSESDLADLGDLVVAAYRDAKAQADELASSALGPLSGGMPGLGGPDQGGAPGPLGFGPAT